MLTRAGLQTPLLGDIPAVVVSHGLQCAQILAVEKAGDLQMQAAGLLHDIGLLLVPGDELGHAQHGANFVRSILGERVAELILLHADAQRYLVATDPTYAIVLPPTVGISKQPHRMSTDEIASFEANPMFADVMELRRADDRSNDPSVLADAAEVGRWMSCLHRIASPTFFRN